MAHKMPKIENMYYPPSKITTSNFIEGLYKKGKTLYRKIEKGNFYKGEGRVSKKSIENYIENEKFYRGTA